MNGKESTNQQHTSQLTNDTNTFLDQFNESLLIDNIYATMESLAEVSEIYSLPWSEIETFYNFAIISLCIQFVSELESDKMKLAVFNKIMKNKIARKTI